MAVKTDTRKRVEAHLDALVAEHRATIALLFPLIGAVLFVASAEGLVGPLLRFNPFLILFGTLVMRLPLIAGLSPLIDRRAAVGLLCLTVYAYAIEFLGMKTGWPYGAFEYTIELGLMLFGAVPLGLPLFFLPLVLNSYLLCLLVLGRAGRKRSVRLPVTVLAVLAADLVLDPAAVAVGIWTYSGGDFLQQILSGFVADVTTIVQSQYERATDYADIETLPNQSTFWRAGTTASARLYVTPYRSGVMETPTYLLCKRTLK